MASPSPPSLPLGWSVHLSPEAQVFYYHMPPPHRIGSRPFSHIRTHATRHRRMLPPSRALSCICACAHRPPPPLNRSFPNTDILKQYLRHVLESCLPLLSHPTSCTSCRLAACLLMPQCSSCSATATKWMTPSCTTSSSRTLQLPCIALHHASRTTSLFKQALLQTPQSRPYQPHPGLQREGLRFCGRLRQTWDLGTSPTSFMRSAALGWGGRTSSGR